MKKEFKPHLIPTVQLNGINEIPESDFPLYYKPLHKGVDLYVRKGFIFFSISNKRVKNFNLNLKLDLIRETSRLLNATIHLTITLTNKTDYLYNQLKNNIYYIVDREAIFNFTDFIIEDYSDEMTSDSRDLNLWLISKGFKSKKNWIFHRDNLAATRNELETYATPQLFLDNVVGLRLKKPGSLYNQGKTNGNSIVNVMLTDVKDLEVLEIQSNLKKHCNSMANLAQTAIIKLDDSIISVDLGKLSQDKQKELWSTRGYFKNAKLKAECVTSNKITEPLIKEVLMLFK